jgi:IS1 family transposase
MNRLSTADRVRVVTALVEGNSLRGTARMTGIARMTVEKLLRDLGTACADYHKAHVNGLTTKRIQCDEIWSFIGAKHRNATPEQKANGWGDCWTWTAIDADSKLIVSYALGPRLPYVARAFMADVAARVSNRVQVTTDGLRVYLDAVERAFGNDVDYAIIDKYYGANPETSTRYSPARFRNAKRAIIHGRPDSQHISTSYVERNNLTIRMHNRRFSRLTNAFSKKVEMHAHSIALHFMYYNFCKIHTTLRVTPAMEAGLSDQVWDAAELVALMDPAVVSQASA